MTKLFVALTGLGLGFAVMAQQPPSSEPAQNQAADNTAQPSAAELAQQLLRQNAAGTNADTAAAQQQIAGELLQALINARQATNAGASAEGEAGAAKETRPIRGQGTRGTAGSSTNAQSLASLITQPPANQATNGEKSLRLNFRNAPLSLVLDYLSDAAGFIISANSKVDLKGTVTVWSNQPVDRNEAVQILQKALSDHNYAATAEGNVLNIYVVDSSNSKIEVGIPGDNYVNIPATKELVTQIVYVHNVEAGQLIQTLQPLMPTGTGMSANQGANAIVITDAQANIRRMAQLVKALDTASVSASTIKVFTLNYADATALVQVVQQLFQGTDAITSQLGGGIAQFFGRFGRGGGGGQPNNANNTPAGRVAAAKVVAAADDRSNSLIVSASQEQMELINELVTKVDVNVDDVTVLKVFRLRYADPEEIADQLANLFPDPTTQQTSGGRQSGPRNFFARLAGGNNASTGPSSRTVKQTRVTAVPDPRTQSVIVSAARDLMDQIADIIHELDSNPAKKKKVYVIKVENRDPQEVVQELQSVISADTSGNINSALSSSQQTANQLSKRQQNNLQNQQNTSSSFLNNSTSRSATGR